MSISPLCQDCKEYLLDLKAEPWEKTKLLCKNEAKHCRHSPSSPVGSSIKYYDQEERLIGKKPLLEFITAGKCQKHPNCSFKRTDWGDETHSNEKERNKENKITSKELEIIENYMIKNRVRQITLKNGKLEIEHEEKGNIEIIVANTAELKTIESYCQQLNHSVSIQEVRREREREREQKSTKALIYWGAGGVLASIIVLGMWWVWRNKKKSIVLGII